MVRATAPEEYKGQKQQSDNHDDFYTMASQVSIRLTINLNMGFSRTRAGEPKLCFAIKLDGKAVQADNDDNHDGNPHGNVDRWVPVVDDETGSGDLVRHENTQRVEVEPAETEAHGARDVAGTEQVHRRTGSGKIGRDLDDAGHNAEDQR